MVGGLVAPARRVGLCHLVDDSGRLLTHEGWALIGAAFDWAAKSPPSRPRSP
jgi:hypothetical protein